MAEVTNELMYELLKKMHTDISQMKVSIFEVRSEMQSMQGTMVSMQQDTHNIYGILARHETRLDRIESRHELRELAEAQSRFEPHP